MKRVFGEHQRAEAFEASVAISNLLRPYRSAVVQEFNHKRILFATTVECGLADGDLPKEKSCHVNVPVFIDGNRAAN